MSGHSQADLDPGCARRGRGERGFTLVEVLAATVMLIVGVLGALSLIDYANKETAKNRDREAANNLARQISETAKKLPYTAITATGIGSSLQAQSGLADADPATTGWQIQSRGLTFTVTANACSVDDSKDGYGTHATGTTWCSSTTGTSDAVPEDYKRLTVSITPPSGSIAGKSTMTSFIADDRLTGSTSGASGATYYAILMNGLCTGCSSNAWTKYGQVAPCSTFTTTVGTDKCNPSYDGSAQANYTGNQITSIPVQAIFPLNAASVKFYLLDYPTYMLSGTNPQFPPDQYLGSGTSAGANTWNYTWNLQNTYPAQTPDGYYAIKAIAYDSGGTATGRPLILSFWLNRFIPDMKYWGVPIAGRNQLWCTGTCPNTSAKPEIEWRAGSTSTSRRDFDIKDYRAYRTGTATIACSVNDYSWRGDLRYNPLPHAGGTSACVDNVTSPVPPTSGTLTYTLQARSFSPDGTAQTEGGNVQAASGNVNSTGSNARPTSVAGLAYQYVTVGTLKYLKFTWTAITTPNPRGTNVASPDCIMGFRFYSTATTVTTLPANARSFRSGTGLANCPSGSGSSAINTYTNPVWSLATATQKWWVTSVDIYNNESVPTTISVPPPP